MAGKRRWQKLDDLLDQWGIWRMMKETKYKHRDMMTPAIKLEKSFLLSFVGINMDFSVLVSSNRRYDTCYARKINTTFGAYQRDCFTILDLIIQYWKEEKKAYKDVNGSCEHEVQQWIFWNETEKPLGLSIWHVRPEKMPQMVNRNSSCNIHKDNAILISNCSPKARIFCKSAQLWKSHPNTVTRQLRWGTASRKIDLVLRQYPVI